MDTVFPPNLTEINGLDLSNYIRDPNSYNPVVYIHKRLVKEVDGRANQCIPIKQDKYQQYDCEKAHEFYSIDINNNDNRDPIVEHTIRFAKDLIPLTIPVDANTDPVYYSLKTSKKSKRKYEPCEHSHIKDGTFEKEKPKCSRDKRKHFKSESLSTTETTTPFSQNNTLDDIAGNRSLCCTSSEISEKKINTHEKNRIKKSNKDHQKLIASESLEAIATEYLNTSSDAAIKIHLMNEKEKHILIKSIQTPLIKALKENIYEAFNQIEVLTQLKSVQKTVYNNSIILENVLDKLSAIEKKLEKYDRDKNETIRQTTQLKASKLEELGEDLLDVKEDLSSEEELVHVNLHKKRDKSAIAAPIHVRNNVEKDEDSLGRGEKVPEHFKATTSQMGMRTDPPHRMPARFCWTDTKIN